MPDYMTLLGAEQVQAAARTIASAADGMQSAASSFSCAVDKLERVLDDHARRIEQALEAHAAKIENSNYRPAGLGPM
jgi:hypothetical protein